MNTQQIYFGLHPYRILLPIVLVFILSLCMFPLKAGADETWPSANGNLYNTRASQDTIITTNNVDTLTVKWQFKTAPDQNPSAPALGSVASTPAVEGDYIYFTDFAGFIYKNNRHTGENIWKKSLLHDLSRPGLTLSQSRNTPLIMGNLLIIGNHFFLTDPLCVVIAKQQNLSSVPSPSPGYCHAGDGAIVLAIDKNTGEYVWSTKVDDFPAAKITGSASGIDHTIFVGVGSWEEDWARSYPYVVKRSDGSFDIDLSKPYPCCSARGSVVALNDQGQILWKTNLSSGVDADKVLPPKVREVLITKSDGSPDRGFFGVSSYGHSPTIDVDRRQIYIATSQTETAPEAAELCEKYRRNQLGIRPDLYGPVGSVANPDNSARFKKAGLTCANLNKKMETYGNAMLALDMDNGKVKWAFYARPYDAWNHVCTPPIFAGLVGVLPFVYPIPLANAANCFQDPVGPDYGFGHNPILLSDIKTTKGKMDIVVAGNKDGRLFALNPDNGKLIWGKSIEPGGIYGGFQFGLASDGKSIYAGTTNSLNSGRDRNKSFVSSEQFLIINGLGNLNPPLRFGLHEKPGSAKNLHEVPGPGDLVLPFFTPFILFGPNSGYPDTGLMYSGPTSGPLEFHQVVNIPADVNKNDGVNVWVDQQGKVFTIAGMIHSIDAATGNINWQRPAIDSVPGTIADTPVFGSVTVSNGIVFAGYADGRGTLVGLDAKTGQRLFLYHNTISYPDPSNPSIMKTVNIGSGEAGPAVIDGVVYWGIGAHTYSLFPVLSNARPELGIPAGQVIFVNGGNSVIAFELAECLNNNNNNPNCNG